MPSSTRDEAERIHNDALQFRQQTQQQCESLIQRSRQELSKIQTIRSAAPAANGGEDSKAVPISRAHRAASRLRSMRGNG